MNKQAITFLSLFTLILVLSVYYLVVPPIDQQTNVQTKQLSKIEVLQNQLNENHENTLAENNDVIASDKTSKKQIQEALTSIEKTNSDIETENTICKLLKEKGYKECFVELDDTHLKVVIKLKEATSKDANRVIKCIQGKYNNKFDIEVKFVED